MTGKELLRKLPFRFMQAKTLVKEFSTAFSRKRG
jgi:hypothetical protein